MKSWIVMMGLVVAALGCAGCGDAGNGDGAETGSEGDAFAGEGGPGEGGPGEGGPGEGGPGEGGEESAGDGGGGGEEGSTGDASAEEGGDTSAEEGGDAGEGGAPEVPTYYGDVEPILRHSCSGCHKPGSIAPFSLETYGEVKALAPIVAMAVKTRRMPPWGVAETEECQPRYHFRNDLRLSDEQIAIVDAWATNGTPEGDPSEAPAASDPVSLELDHVDLELEVAQPYLTEGKDDELICFVLDPKLDVDSYIRAIRVIPGNPLVAHHALVFSDPNAESLMLADENGQFPCFGSPGVSGTSLLAGWAPGGVPMKLPPNAGMPISAGTLLVLQMHYHPIGAPELDATRLQIELTNGEPEWHSLTALIGNSDSQEDQDNGLQPGPNDPEGEVAFVVPANAHQHIELMRFTNPADLNAGPNPEHHIFAVAPHMHYLGVDMKISVRRRPLDEPLCPAAEINPFLSCYMLNCAAADDVIDCIGDKCGAEYDNLSGLCTGCLIGNAHQNPNIAQVVTGCSSARTYDTPEQPAEECFLHAPHYDFNWQRFYAYDAAIEELPIVRPGDVLEFRCTYDNTLDNDALAAALAYQGLDAPIDVYLGETTLDEMCLGAFQTLYKPQSAPSAQ